MAQYVARMGIELVRVVGIINLTSMEINEMIRLLEEYKARGITKVFVSEVFFTGMNNGSRLGEVGDFENETLKLLLNLNWNTNVEFTTEPPILPNRC